MFTEVTARKDSTDTVMCFTRGERTTLTAIWSFTWQLKKEHNLRKLTPRGLKQKPLYFL